MSDKKPPCERCNGTGRAPSIPAFMAILYQIGNGKNLPKPTGTIECPDCLNQQPNLWEREDDARR